MVTVVRGEVGHAWLMSYCLRLLFVSSPQVYLIAFSINRLKILLFFAVVLHSPSSLSKSLLTQSYHRIIGLPLLLFTSTFWTSALFANFSSPILSTRPS